VNANPQTNTQTDRGDYNTLRSLAHSVITLSMSESSEKNSAYCVVLIAIITLATFCDSGVNKVIKEV